MIQKTKNHNVKYNAFTLIEMIIVLIVMGIMLMVTLFLSGDQIQKVRDKTVKETILAEMQSRYSRNLGSSSFAGTIYDHLDITFSKGKNEITFGYYTGDSEGQQPFLTGHLMDSFEIKYMGQDYDYQSNPPQSSDNIILRYNPYKMYCEIRGEAQSKNLVLIVGVNDSRNYCFEINQKNCRLIEVSESKCCTLKTSLGLKCDL